MNVMKRFEVLAIKPGLSKGWVSTKYYDLLFDSVRDSRGGCRRHGRDCKVLLESGSENIRSEYVRSGSDETWNPGRR
jgi:hypothetical protein